jgi:hypothetical protein
MNIPQTTYNQYFLPAILGMQAFAGELSRKISRVGIGIIYYGRVVVQSRLSAYGCRMPRSNKVVITDSAGTWTAGPLVTVITFGTLKNGEEAAVSNTAITVSTGWVTDKATSMALHAANIKTACADCYSCAYDGSAHTITMIGDALDVISSATSVTGITGNMTISSETITTADVFADILGLSYLTHDRQQQLTTGYAYYADKEPVNIAQSGSIWVQSEELVTPQSTVYGRLITNSTKYAGYLGASSDSSKCVAFTGSRFLLPTVLAATGDTFGLAPITINLPQ